MEPGRFMSKGNRSAVMIPPHSQLPKCAARRAIICSCLSRARAFRSKLLLRAAFSNDLFPGRAEVELKHLSCTGKSSKSLGISFNSSNVKEHFKNRDAHRETCYNLAKQLLVDVPFRIAANATKSTCISPSSKVIYGHTDILISQLEGLNFLVVFRGHIMR